MLLAVLMVYLIAAAILCAVSAANIGGTPYRVMLFSILVTYGGKFIMLDDLAGD